VLLTDPWENAEVAALAESLSVPSLWAYLLMQRGIRSAAAYQAWVESPVDGESVSRPEDLPDLPQAADLLRRALTSGQAIRVHGDYDADGVTATAILVRALNRVAPRARVDWHIPSRFDEGYGLSVNAVWRAHESGVGLMVTVDCGSSSPDAAQLAESLGMTLVITDHHRLPNVLPVVPALVNPERMAVPQVLSGAGVALQLSRQLLGDEAPPVLWGLAAVGTVADVVPLLKESRGIVRRGLEALSGGAVPGITALLEVAGRDPRRVRAADVAFQAGPRINAAGRMGQPEPAVGLCLTDDADVAREQAAVLDVLNRRRRDVEAAVAAEAVAQVDARSPLPPFLVASGPWHEGVIGIVAARLAERYRRPAAVVAINGEVGKGSVRSGGHGDVSAALALAADHFTKWGGHRGAAGFSIRQDRLPTLESALSAAWLATKDRSGADVRAALDAVVPVEALTPELARFLATLEPFGQGFPPLRFQVHGLVEAAETMGPDGRHLRLHLRGQSVPSVGFGLGAHAKSLVGRRVVGQATLDVGQFRGREQIQLRWDTILEPWGPPGSLAVGDWQLGRPEPAMDAVLVLVGSRRQQRCWQRRIAQAGAAWQVQNWWRPDGWERSPSAALWIVAPPPHVWALRAALGQVRPGGVVYWESAAWNADGAHEVLRKWRRLVPDRERLLRLWRQRRQGQQGLVPGAAVLAELGLEAGQTPAQRRDLAESVRWVAAQREYARAEADWRAGGPRAWRQSGKGADTADGGLAHTGSRDS